MKKAINIKWDTDGDTEALNNLPTEIKIPDWVYDEEDSQEDIIEDISNYISNETGFCHNGFELVDMKKYLVKVVETFEHTFVVNADSKDEAEDIVNSNPNGGCDPFDDYVDREYVTRCVKDNDDLSLYDELDEFEE